MFEINVELNLEEFKDILKELIIKDIKNYNIWDNEELTKFIENYFKDLVKEILLEKKDEIKKEVEEAIKENAVDIALDSLYENFRN